MCGIILGSLHTSYYLIFTTILHDMLWFWVVTEKIITVCRELILILHKQTPISLTLPEHVETERSLQSVCFIPKVKTNDAPVFALNPPILSPLLRLRKGTSFLPEGFRNHSGRTSRDNFNFKHPQAWVTLHSSSSPRGISSRSFVV